MAYQVENGVWSNVFAVPSAVVDQHIKLCGPLSLKVLLVLLRHGGRMEPQELAALLNQPVTDVQDAMNYWVQMGVITQADSAQPSSLGLSQQPVEQVHPQENTAAALVAYEEAPAKTELRRESETQNTPQLTRITRSRQRFSTAEINEMAEKDETIAYLLQETQSCLGKPLTPVATDVVVALYSYYGMEPDLVLMLLHYCVSIGKGSMRYVEKVAASWLESGIDTHEKAEKEILRRTRQNQSENKVKTAFGIYDRSLVASEKKYIETWLEEYGMDISLIQLAYERTVELKGKLSFPYINGILTNWHKNGITTPAQALKEMQQGGYQKAGQARGRELKEGAASYDLDILEKMIDSGRIV